MTPLTLYATQALAEERIAKLHDLAETEHQLRALRRRQPRARRPGLIWRLAHRHAAATR
jgi:hypothetical protein